MVDFRKRGRGGMGQVEVSAISFREGELGEFGRGRGRPRRKVSIMKEARLKIDEN